MLTARRRLSQPELDAVAALETAVVAHDGGRLKLEWASLADRRDEGVNDLLWRADDGALVGFAGVYDFGDAPIEVAGMVHPDHRRHGIGRALVTAAAGAVRERGRDHALLLVGPPAPGPADPATSVRPAGVDDVPAIRALLADGFGSGEVALDEPGAQNLVVEGDGEPIGYLRTRFDGERGDIYGFVIRPDRRGRGIGRDVLRRVCDRLRAVGADAVGLEVAVDNPAALHLYTSLGFAPVITEEYFRLDV